MSYFDCKGVAIAQKAPINLPDGNGFPGCNVCFKKNGTSAVVINYCALSQFFETDVSSVLIYCISSQFSVLTLKKWYDSIESWKISKIHQYFATMLAECVGTQNRALETT